MNLCWSAILKCHVIVPAKMKGDNESAVSGNSLTEPTEKTYILEDTSRTPVKQVILKWVPDYQTPDYRTEIVTLPLTLDEYSFPPFLTAHVMMSEPTVLAGAPVP